MSEELDNSLLESIQSYLDERLRAIDEQLAQLQTDFNDACTRLRDNAARTPLEGTPLSATIAAHLQTAREQKLSGAAQAPASPDLSSLNRAIVEIRSQHTQSDALASLLRSAVQFADRAILFVVKGEQAIAWRACEAHDRTRLNSLSGIAVALSTNNVVSEAARSASVETPSAHRAEDAGLMQQLGGEVQQLAAMPLVVRQKVVAVLYVDSAWPHREAIQLSPLEALVHVAAMAIEMASPARATQPAHVTAPEQPEESTATTPAPEAVAEPAPPPVEETAEQPTMVAEQPASEEHAEETVETPAPAESVADEIVAAAPVEDSAVEPSRPEEIPPPPAVEPEPAAPVFTAQYSAPLGTARRYGGPEAELPIEVNEDERRLHHDARRFARLLVSEIKLYNEQKVSEGRNQSDIYDRLREDIDRSRQMYDKRVAPPVAALHDYFHQELVNTLAEGDPAKLGASYPGAAVGVS